MVDEEIQTPPGEGTIAQIESAAPKRAARGKNAAAGKAGPSPSTSPKAKTRGLSDVEKLEKIGQIDAQVAGGETLKAAVRNAGISDQTYYQWKKATAQVPAAAVSEDNEFAEFIQLEEENRRLRKLLAEKLRAENADLRKRLGMK